MSRNAKVEGTKIAQAAKDLNVTSVTIRRYITEFNIETTSDENGIKVLPDVAMEELQKVRELKEEGLTNPQVLEKLEEMRTSERKPAKGKAKAKTATRVKAEPEVVEEEEEKPAARSKEKEKEKEKDNKRPAKRISKKEAPPEDKEEEEIAEEEEKPEAEGDADSAPAEGESGEGKPKHSLTCQTCGKVFEHMNPRLRDCLDCYRAKRKERRRGGAERHKNVIQHPLAQQAASRQAQRNDANGVAAETDRYAEEPKRAPQRDRDRDRDRDRPERTDRADRSDRTERIDRADREPAAAAAYVSQPSSQSQVVAQGLQRTVRNYRKAIEETRNITGSLKRRLERPDLPEGERRWLEQIYAYQLILHQGWRHLAEYKAATQQQKGGGGMVSSAPASSDD
ncbi:MAG: hypothetical protein DKT66_15400 [Candidatus Melainabacteria bacterium]|nr:MAG: hypothetical protein DKT66_15400 [Candidatus Melainabacteria bacterium]